MDEEFKDIKIEDGEGLEDELIKLGKGETERDIGEEELVEYLEKEFNPKTIEDIFGKSNVKQRQYQDMLVNIGEIMENLNGFPRDLNRDVWDNKPYDERFEYLNIRHKDMTTLNITRSLLKNILFKMVKDGVREGFYGEILSYYFGVDEEQVIEDIQNYGTSESEDKNYLYCLKLIHYKENNKGVPDIDG